MSFLKQMLKPFVEFDEEKKKGTEKNNPSFGPANPKTTDPLPGEKVEHPLITDLVKPATVAGSTNQIPTYSPSGTIEGPLPEHQAYFERLIDEANAKNPFFHGADFKEFIDSKLDIDDISDEALKYQTAFNILKKSGLTKEKLISTGEEYLKIIGRDLNAFQAAHAQQYKKELGADEVIIQKKAEELLILTQKSNALKKEINKLTQDLSLKKERLNTTKNSFLLAGEKKQTEIQTELQKIAQYFY
jgi:hypothetical protein